MDKKLLKKQTISLVSNAKLSSATHDDEVGRTRFVIMVFSAAKTLISLELRSKCFLSFGDYGVEKSKRA